MQLIKKGFKLVVDLLEIEVLTIVLELLKVKINNQVPLVQVNQVLVQERQEDMVLLEMFNQENNKKYYQIQ